MNIRVKDMIGILSLFDENDTVDIGTVTKCTLGISHQFGSTQVQFVRDDDAIKYRIISTEEQYQNPEYKFL